MAYDETQRRISLDADASIGYYTGVAGMRGSLGPLSAPTGLAVVVEGTTGSTTYRYVVTATNARGQTLGSQAASTSTGNATLTGSNYNALSWNAVDGASAYNVYRGSAGSEVLLKSGVTGTTYSDNGTDTAGSTPLPTVNTAGNNGGEQYHFVKVTGVHQAGLCNTAGESRIGVLQNKPQRAGEAATVCIGGVSLVEAAATIAAGAKVSTDANGMAVTQSGSNAVAGTALENGSAGSLFAVLVN